MSSLEPEAPYRGCLEVEACSEDEPPRVKRGAWRGPSDFGSPGVKPGGRTGGKKGREGRVKLGTLDSLLRS